jgi:hypothetical protein
VNVERNKATGKIGLIWKNLELYGKIMSGDG